MSSKIRSTSLDSERKYSSSSDEDTFKITSSRGENSSPLKSKKSPSKGYKQSPRKYKSSSEEEDEPFVRTHVWWKELFAKQRVNLKETLEKVLYWDLSLYRDIIIAYGYQSEQFVSVEPSEVLPNHWLFSTETSDNRVQVLDNDFGQAVLDDLLEFKYLPKRLPDGSKMPKIKTIDQLIALMIRFNPEYVLELAAHTLTDRDFGGFEMSYYTDKVDVKSIRKDLKALLKSLK